MGSPFAALKVRDFQRYQGGRFVAVISMEMLSVAVGWHLYTLTGSALALGFVGLAQFAPAFLLSLPAGHVADHFDRRQIIRACYLLYAVVAGLLCVLVTRASSVNTFYFVLALAGVARAFSAPANQALLPHVVGTENLGNAVAWGSTTFKIANIIGPSLGGVIYALGGARTVFATACAGFLLATMFITAMKIRLEKLERSATTLRTVLAGVRYVWRKKIILGSITLDLFAVLLGGAVVLLPIFARDILHTGPMGLGLLRGAPAVGAMVTAVWLAYHPVERKAGMTMFVAVACFGIATIIFGLSHSFVVTLLALAATGAADMVSVFVRMTLVPLVTPPDMRGRVGAVNFVFIGASNELGDFESGVVAQWLGAVPAVLVGGVGTLVVVALGAWIFPSLRKLDRLDSHAADDQ